VRPHLAISYQGGSRDSADNAITVEARAPTV
jgi:hypothetical protein